MMWLGRVVPCGVLVLGASALLWVTGWVIGGLLLDLVRA